jgi:Tol biopolymer transport system component
MRRVHAPVLVLVLVLVAGCGGGGGGGGAPAPSLPDQLERIDRDAAGHGGDGGDAHDVRLNADGRFAVFSSNATDLDPAATSGVHQIYRKDRLTGALVLVSRAWAAPGRPAGDGDSLRAAISDDGNVVAFESAATNLVAGDTTGHRDVFVVDLAAAHIDGVSAGFAGGNADSARADVSGDGKLVGFESSATNLVLGDTNGTDDVFIYDTQTGGIRRVSVDGAGAQHVGWSQHARLNRDGSRVVFESGAAFNAIDANGKNDVYLRDLAALTTTRVSIGYAVEDTDNHSSSPAFTRDGGFVAFASDATGLVIGDTNAATDIFVSDRATRDITRESVTDLGGQAATRSAAPDLSDDGRYVVFENASALVAADTNGVWDVYVRDRVGHRTRLVAVPPGGTVNNDQSSSAAIARDGSAIGFIAIGTALPGGSSSRSHAYVTPNPILAGG